MMAARPFTALSCLIFLSCAHVALSEAASKTCLASDERDCVAADAWSKVAQDDDGTLGLELLQLRALAPSRNCPLPDSSMQEISDGTGKGCPEGEEKNCLEGNAAYSSLSEAWAKCGLTPNCGAVLSHTNGKFYMRRESDPTTHVTGAKLFTYRCVVIKEEDKQAIDHFAATVTSKFKDITSAGKEEMQQTQQMPSELARIKEDFEKKIEAAQKKAEKAAKTKAKLEKTIKEVIHSVTDAVLKLRSDNDDAEADEATLTKAESFFKANGTKAAIVAAKTHAAMAALKKESTKPAKEAEGLLQFEESRAIRKKCPVPSAAQASHNKGKGCPDEGSRGVYCLNDNIGYENLAAAWEECGARPQCGAVMKYHNGRFYLRRATDPDINGMEGVTLFGYECDVKDAVSHDSQSKDQDIVGHDSQSKAWEHVAHMNKPKIVTESVAAEEPEKPKSVTVEENVAPGESDKPESATDNVADEEPDSRSHLLEERLLSKQSADEASFKLDKVEDVQNEFQELTEQGADEMTETEAMPSELSRIQDTFEKKLDEVEAKAQEASDTSTKLEETMKDVIHSVAAAVMNLRKDNDIEEEDMNELAEAEAVLHEAEEERADKAEGLLQFGEVSTKVSRKSMTKALVDAILTDFQAAHPSQGSKAAANKGLEAMEVSSKSSSVTICPVPDQEHEDPKAFSTMGKGCPTPGKVRDMWGVSCLDGNTGYDSLSAAWAKCGQTANCGAVMKYTDGLFYLRRLTDPDDATIKEAKVYTYSCQPNKDRVATESFATGIKEEFQKITEIGEEAMQETKAMPSELDKIQEIFDQNMQEARSRAKQAAETKARLEATMKEVIHSVTTAVMKLRTENDYEKIDEDDLEKAREILEGARVKNASLLGNSTLLSKHNNATMLKEHALIQFGEARMSGKICPVPDGKKQEVLAIGKRCPLTNGKEGEASCLDNNKALDSLSQAWDVCGRTEECGAVMEFSNGKFYMRRTTDPDDDLIEGARLYLYKCESAIQQDLPAQPSKQEDSSAADHVTEDSSAAERISVDSPAAAQPKEDSPESAQPVGHAPAATKPVEKPLAATRPTEDTSAATQPEEDLSAATPPTEDVSAPTRLMDDSSASEHLTDELQDEFQEITEVGAEAMQQTKEMPSELERIKANFERKIYDARSRASKAAQTKAELEQTMKDVIRSVTGAVMKLREENSFEKDEEDVLKKAEAMLRLDNDDTEESDGSKKEAFEIGA